MAVATSDHEWVPISGIHIPLPGSVIDIGEVSFTQQDVDDMRWIINKVGDLEFAKLVLGRGMDTASVQILISYLKGNDSKGEKQ